MYNFILQTLIMLSLGTMIYLAARALPRVSETAWSAKRKNHLDDLIKKVPFEKIDAFLNGAAFKFLRKLKVAVLKLDNWIGNSLEKVKAEKEKLDESPK